MLSHGRLEGYVERLTRNIKSENWRAFSPGEHRTKRADADAHADADTDAHAHFSVNCDAFRMNFDAFP